jgi:hypothetical protein
LTKCLTCHKPHDWKAVTKSAVKQN